MFASDLAAFRTALVRENRTLKRALTDPRIVDGIGNAYSDEILHAARLSPIARTHSLIAAEWERLYAATRTTLRAWIERLRAEAAEAFPGGRDRIPPGDGGPRTLRQAVPDCGEPVQRIRYADNETNYCARCQTARHVARRPQPFAAAQGRLAQTLDELETQRSRGPREYPAVGGPHAKRQP